jgi:circadian clock protein KaiB
LETKRTAKPRRKPRAPKDRSAQYERAIRARKPKHYVLTLYVAGMNPRSARAISNIKELCEEMFSDRYELEVVDIYRQPKLAEGEQIIAVPTLIKKLPLPLRRFIGDMSDRQQILLGLDLKSG